MSHRVKKTPSSSSSSALPSFRDHATTKLQKLLGEGEAEQQRAFAIEAALYARYGASMATPSHDYSSHLRTLLYNLPKNSYLLARVRHGELTAGEIAALSPDDLLPREEREKQQEAARKAFDLQRLDHVAPQVAAMEDRVGLSCPACGSHRVGTVRVRHGLDRARVVIKTYLTHFPLFPPKQLRRNAITDAEEAMVEASCESCGKSWVAQEQAVGEGW